MATTLQDAIEAIQALVLAVPGIRKAPDYAPEQVNVFPFAVCYPSSGSWQTGPVGVKKGLHTIALELHVARQDLPRGLKNAMKFSDSVPNTLLNHPTLNGTVDTIVEPIEYSFGALKYAEIDTLGWTFQIEVKMQSVIT